MLGRILDTYLLALALISVHDLQPCRTESDLVRVTGFFDISHTFRVYIFLGTSRESIYECEVSFLDSFCGYREILFRLIWNVLF